MRLRRRGSLCSFWTVFTAKFSDRPGEEAEITSAACKTPPIRKKPVLFIGIFLLQEWPVLPHDTPRNPQSVPGGCRHHAVPAQ